MALEVEEFTVTGSVTHQVTLSYTPVNPVDVAVDPIGGPAQVYGTDFLVTGDVLTWNLVGSDILQVVTDGYPTKLRVLYER